MKTLSILVVLFVFSPAIAQDAQSILNKFPPCVRAALMAETNELKKIIYTSTMSQCPRRTTAVLKACAVPMRQCGLGAKEATALCAENVPPYMCMNLDRYRAALKAKDNPPRKPTTGECIERIKNASVQITNVRCVRLGDDCTLCVDKTRMQCERFLKEDCKVAPAKAEQICGATILEVCDMLR